MTDKTEAPEQIWINPEEWNKYSGPCVGDPAVPYVPKALLDQKQELFERMWKADMRGIEAWQKAHPGNDMIWPDRAKMMEWLCGQRFEGTDACAEVTGPAQEPDPITSDFAKVLDEHRESIPVAIMDHIDKLQRQIDFSRGGKYGPTAESGDFPDVLYLPTSAFEGFSKYLNIFGTDHVCDGDPHVVYVNQKAGIYSGSMVDGAFAQIETLQAEVKQAHAAGRAEALEEAALLIESKAIYTEEVIKNTPALTQLNNIHSIDRSRCARKDAGEIRALKSGDKSQC